MRPNPEALKGKLVTIKDPRTGVAYSTPVLQSKWAFGRYYVILSDNEKWVQLTPEELESVK